MSDPGTILNSRLIQCHGLAYTMSDISGDALCHEAIRTAFYGLAELISQAQDAFDQLETVRTKPKAEPASRNPIRSETGYMQAVNTLQALADGLIRRDGERICPAETGNVITLALKELERSVVL